MVFASLDHHRMLLQGVNFINILFAPFLPIFFCQKKLKSQNVTREKLSKVLSYEKCAGKMLMKLTKG